MSSIKEQHSTSFYLTSKGQFNNSLVESSETLFQSKMSRRIVPEAGCFSVLAFDVFCCFALVLFPILPFCKPHLIQFIFPSISSCFLKFPRSPPLQSVSFGNSYRKLYLLINSLSHSFMTLIFVVIIISSISFMFSIYFI